MHKQLANAQVKLERAQQNAEEKRAQSQQTLERLQEEYEKMVVDRQVNDRKVEELRAEADEVERQVTLLRRLSDVRMLMCGGDIDGGASAEEPGGAYRAVDGVLEAET